ncbi:MAG: hypothetical protein DRJ42_10110 [Deltaproteobacteria bacterium]|nr:MAG: hypothetical protein DRJ42_10110 [Deltaproteobacteria bacterium]
MKNKHLSILLALALPFAVACGDDGTTPTDSGTGDSSMGDTGTLPSRCTFPDEQTDPCCQRTSNADQLDAPELRISGVQLSQPSSLSSIIVSQLLTDALNDDLFNWLLTANITGTTAEITTGFGQKSPAAVFSFTMDAAPAPGDPSRWNPVMMTGSMDGETLSAPELSETFTVPIFTEDGTTVQLELPLRNMTLSMLTFTEERSCVGGTQPGGRWDTAQGSIQAYITVADADAGRLVAGPIDTTLCMFTAGMPAMDGTCADYPQSGWAVQPDAICDDTTGCAADPGDGTVCDPSTTCNAWLMIGGIAAQAVDIQ